MARTFHGILEACGATRPVLVGQSLGGYVAQAYLGLFPARAAAFVSIGSSPLQRRYYKGWHLAALRHMEGLCRLWGTERFLRGQIAGNCSATEHGWASMLRQIEPCRSGSSAHCTAGASGRSPMPRNGTAPAGSTARS